MNKDNEEKEKDNEENDTPPKVMTGGSTLCLPGLTALFFSLFTYALIGFALNALLALSALVFSNIVGSRDSFWPVVETVFSVADLFENGQALVLGSIAVAALISALGPLHAAHDLTIKFLFGLELCDKLANITSKLDPGDFPKTKAWGKKVIKRHYTVRRDGKWILIGYFLMLGPVILAPWIYVLNYYWNWDLLLSVFTVALFFPVLLLHIIEMYRTIWPSETHMVLGFGTKSP